MKLLLVALPLSLLCGAADARQLSRDADSSSALEPEKSPIRKVITLIEAMKEQVDKDAADDLAAHDKYMCWCSTNEKAKTEAIEQATSRVEELSAFIQESSAKTEQLKSEITSLKTGIAEDQEALAAAEATREKELAAFQAEEADLKETVAMLTEAVGVLSKVQLLQRGGRTPVAEQARAQAALLQVQEKVRSLPRSRFASVLQRDLFSVLGALGDGTPGLRGAAAFEQAGAQSQLDDAPAGGGGARSSGILGVLSQMLDQFTSDLAATQKQDFEAETSFQSLKVAKSGEIQAASDQLGQKEAEVADTADAAAKAEEDLEATKKAVEADQAFLATLKTDCPAQDAEYHARAKVRSDEQAALGETLTILTEDGARELYEKTGTFLQVSSGSRAMLKERAARRAMKTLARVGMKHKSWALMSLAVHGGMDAFTKVKEAMDKMTAELQRQKKEDYEKKEFCNKEIDRVEDEIKTGVVTQEGLNEKHQQLVNSLEALKTDIETLTKEEADMQVSLKQAGENRKAENQLYQTAVEDQRATIEILHKAMKRLEKFYAPSPAAALVQEPGQAVSPKPEAGKAYSKSGASGGVMQLLAKVVSDAEVEEKEMQMDEQHAQENYAAFVQVTTKAVEAARTSMEEKSALAAEAESAKAETESAQLSNDESLAQLGELLKAHHLDCDFLLKFFDVRDKARAEELDAIADAKAVLSGADFGK